jgi:hypothetical protein
MRILSKDEVAVVSGSWGFCSEPEAPIGADWDWYGDGRFKRCLPRFPYSPWGFWSQIHSHAYGVCYFDGWWGSTGSG